MGWGCGWDGDGDGTGWDKRISQRWRWDTKALRAWDGRGKLVRAGEGVGNLQTWCRPSWVPSAPPEPSAPLPEGSRRLRPRGALWAELCSHPAQGGDVSGAVAAVSF